jgi:hypothetical protein
MLGRRSAAVAALFSAAVFGGGGALAATHGSAKPLVKKPAAAHRQVPRAAHHCHLWNTNPGGAATAAQNL